MNATQSKMYAMMLMFGAAMASNEELEGMRHISEKKLTPEQRQAVKMQKHREIQLANGLKEYTRSGISVFALNKKNADRKLGNVLSSLREKGFVYLVTTDQWIEKPKN